MCARTRCAVLHLRQAVASVATTHHLGLLPARLPASKPATCQTEWCLPPGRAIGACFWLATDSTPQQGIRDFQARDIGSARGHARG